MIRVNIKVLGFVHELFLLTPTHPPTENTVDFDST